MEKHPNQLKTMSKKAHEMHNLDLLALESRRKNFHTNLRIVYLTQIVRGNYVKFLLNRDY